MVDKANVKRGIMDDQFCTFNKGYKIFNYLVKTGLVIQELVGNSMHGDCAVIYNPIRINVDVEAVAGQSAVNQLYATYFDDPVPFLGV